MKSKVMDRPMFKENGVDPENVGIMAGFKDMEDDEDMPSKMLELMGAQVEEDDEEYEGQEAVERSPSSPEILMNNLRGDMRSVDARKEELADLVGYRAAAETPDEVLALLQPVLAQQGAMPAAPTGAPMPAGMPPMPPEAVGGIGALPQAEMAPPIEGAPLNMANGGIVQRFQEGSDEDGVTPAGTQAQRFYSPEFVAKAHSEMANFMAQAPAVEPDLKAQVALRKPIYQGLLGDTKDLTQAQILFDLAQGAFQYGANVDEQGRPMRGSQAARLMGAFRGVPARIGARAAEMEKQERAVSLAALQAAEKDISNIRDANTKLMEAKRRIYTDALKAPRDAGFGTGVKAVALNTMVQLTPEYEAGTLDPQKRRLFETAITEYTQPEYTVDPQTGRNTLVRQPALPSYVQNAIANSPFSKTSKKAGPAAPAGEAVPGVAGTTGAAGAIVPQIISTTGGNVVVPGTLFAGAPPKNPPPVLYSTAQPSMFNAAKSGTGVLLNIPKAFAERVPIVGAFVSGEENIDAVVFLRAAAGQLNRSLATNPRFSEGERKQIQKDIDALPALIDTPEAYQRRLIGLDTLLRQIRAKHYMDGYENENIGVSDARAARLRISDIDFVRDLMGVPPRITDFGSKEEFDKLPAGSAFINSKGQIVFK
jgi:hypothetical protein